MPCTQRQQQEPGRGRTRTRGGEEDEKEEEEKKTQDEDLEESCFYKKQRKTKAYQTEGKAELVIRTGMLSAGLKRKFSHLCIDS